MRVNRRPLLPEHGGGHGWRFLIGVSAENRRAAGVAAGDQVVVHLELDTAPSGADLPADLDAALAGDPEARAAFDDALSPSRKRWHVLSMEGAKTPETPCRRIDRSLRLLAEERHI